MASLDFHAWYTIAVVIIMFLALSFTKIRTEIGFLSAMIALLCGGVLNADVTFDGFSSESVIVVAVLYVVISGLTFTGVLNWIVRNVMGMPKTLSGSIVRLMIPVAFLSSLLSNTTVVALFINVVKMWSAKMHIAPSKLLIPLSYASGMGGICTLIGTPPNLIISGLYTEDTGVQLSILTPTVCGVFCLCVGIISMLALQKLLPERQSPMSSSNIDDFVAELHIPSNHPAIGMDIQEVTEKYHLDTSSLRISAIKRFDGEYVYPVQSDEFLIGGDRLYVIGKASDILDAIQQHGFVCPNLDGVLENEALTEKAETVPVRKTLLSTVILIAMVLLSAFGILPLLNSCLLAAVAMIITGCTNSSQAMNSINWNILIVFAGSVCIGNAIETTGIAEVLAHNILDFCGTNPYIVLFVICLVGTFITEFISNTAAGAMFYPIAMSAAETLNVNPLTFCVALMISVSSSFATPIGSPTHTLVYVPGGYRFSDFLKIGVIMNFIILFANIFITTIVFPF